MMLVTIGCLMLAGILLSAFISGFTATNIPFLILGIFLILSGLSNPPIRKTLFGGGKIAKALKILCYSGVVFLLFYLFVFSSKTSVPMMQEFKKASALTGDGASVVRNLEAAQKINGDDPAIDQNLGIAYAIQKEYAKAEEAFQKALSVKPGDAMIHYNLGLLSQKQEQWDISIERFKRSIYLDPYYEPAYTFLGLSYANKNDVVNAIYYFRMAMKLNPGYFTPRLFLAELEFEQNMYDDSKEECEILLSMDPPDYVKKNANDLLAKIDEATQIYAD